MDVEVWKFGVAGDNNFGGEFMEDLIELRNILLNAADISWENSLYMSNDNNWSLNSLCYLFNLNNLEGNEDISQFAVNNNLDYVLSMAHVQDIVANAYQQNPKCSELDLFKAFLYYHKNDAFITF